MWQLMLLFLVKILAGIGYAKFYLLPKYHANADTWRFYRLSLAESDWLKKDPSAFISDLFIYGYNKSGNLFSGENSYWNDLKSNVLVKIMALMNVITLDSYYTNIILFNFLFLFGLVALLRIFVPLNPQRKYLLIGAIFMLPSTLFWCSGIHKDGLLLSATGLVIFYFDRCLKSDVSVKAIVVIVVCFLLIFAMRNYVLFAILPALFCWWYSEKRPTKTLMAFTAIFLVGIAMFFLIPTIIPSLNFPLFLANKQNEFLRLQGTSAVTTTPLQPNFGSYLHYLPTALDMAFLRPHITEARSLTYIPAVLETLVIVVITIVPIFFKEKNKVTAKMLFFIFFSLTVVIIAGYTVTFTGAIVRYRSFAWPLLIAPLICMIDLERLKNKITFLRRTRVSKPVR